MGFLRDALGSELTSQDISQREVNLDKELIQLIQLACKSDKQQRALDAAALLHHVQSFDMAIKVVAFYHLVGLQEKITTLKNERMGTDRLEEEREQRKRWGKHSTPVAALRNHSEDSSRHHFEDFAPPTVAIRKSLAPATPIINNTHVGRDDLDSSGRGPKGIAASVVAMRAEATDPSPLDKPLEEDASFSSTGEGKRKRDAIDTPELDVSTEGAINKKRALLPLDTPQSIPTNLSKSRMAPFICNS